MPTPKSGESEKDYVSRCIPMVLKEGTAKNEKQAAAICYSMFRDKTKDAMSVKGYESPEPGNLPEKGAKMLAEVYASCRKNGGDKELCSKEAWSAVHKAGFVSDMETCDWGMIRDKVNKIKDELLKKNGNK